MPRAARSLRIARCSVRFQSAPSAASPSLPSRISRSFGIIAPDQAQPEKLALTIRPICLRSPLRCNILLLHHNGSMFRLRYFSYGSLSFDRVGRMQLWIHYMLIRVSWDQRLFGGYPKLFAAFRALHRLSAPRHPPHALSSLTAFIPSSACLRSQRTEQCAALPPNYRWAVTIHCSFSYGCSIYRSSGTLLATDELLLGS
jgi:hypothetical protein